MLERQKKNYRKQKYFINDNENINIKLKEREEIIVLFN